MESASWAVTGCTALVGRDLQPVANATVVVADGAIDQAGHHEAASLPRGLELIDGAGMTVLPGFIDAHVHLGFFPPHSVVAGGVTSVRDLGWPPDLIFEVARASESAAFDGPGVLAAGAMLTAPGGYPTRAAWAPPGTGVEVADGAAGRAAVEAMVQRGAAVIKVALNPPVGPTFDLATLGAIVDSAHAAGLRVTSHTYGIHELEKALDAGVDELAHMVMGTEMVAQEIVARMVAQEMTVVPTLAIRTGAELAIGVQNLRTFAAAGGRVIYGTDLGNAGPGPGIDAREISLMASAGMSPLSIIASATTRAAQWLRLGSTGTIEPGYDADIIAVTGDPLSDLATLSDPKMVFRRGRRVI